MSININMNYRGLSCAERADIERRRKNRITEVRHQSKQFAQQVRADVQNEKQNQLRRIQEIKQKELDELKRRQCDEIHREYGKCLSNFGAAHIAACEASCEEDEVVIQKREEYDLMAAERGRHAMLQEQRKREREAEQRLAKKKRSQQKSVSVQADLVSRSGFSQNVRQDEIDEDEEQTRVENFISRPNPHRTATNTNYNPKNFTSNSIDSSNNYDSEEEVEDSSLEPESSEVEFNQISNLLRQRPHFAVQPEPRPSIQEEIVEISESSEDEPAPPPPKSTQPKQSKTPVKVIKKSILKKATGTKAKEPKPKNTKPAGDNRVKYVDFGNKFVSSYVPEENLVTRNEPTSKADARSAAKKHELRGMGKSVSNDVLRQLAEIRSKEALEKEKTRRDYEKLRLELDEVAKEDQEARDIAAKAFKNFSTIQLEKQEKARKLKMNQAVEDVMRRNIVTCPPVDIRQKNKRKTAEINVAAPESSSSSSISPPTGSSKVANEEMTHLVKIERLKDLLERINHQKKLLLHEIEKSEEIPGRDIDQVMECLKKLEKEKAALDVRPTKKESEELQARERKVEQREKRLEQKIKELYKVHKEQTSAESVVSTSDDGIVSQQPVEIIIKVQQPKSPRKPRKIRCIDTLSRSPKRVYPKTPKKKQQRSSEDEQVPEAVTRVKMVQQQTQTSPTVSEIIPKPILKKPQDARTSRSPATSNKSEDSSQSISTSYQSLPDRIQVPPPIPSDMKKKPHQKLNPVLLHYITRLLGMNRNIGKQLKVPVSPVETPGSSTINTSGNNDSSVNSQAPSFDQDRLARLREFINDNYSFLSEVNETLERSQLKEQNEESINMVDGIWRDTLQKKKPKSIENAKSVKKQTNSVQETAKNVPATQNVPQKTSPPKPQRPPPPKISTKQPVRPQTAKPPPTVIKKPVSVRSNPPSSRPSTQSGQPSTQPPPQPQISPNDMMNITKYLESHMLNNYAEYTANYQRRIADLAQMMERVRQEKLKIIENSLSSGEFGHFTEYKEIAVPGKPQDAPTTSASDLKDSPSQREDPPSEEINNIMKQTRPFGVSKDSGISMLSRPVTSSDFRDSPDVRVTSEERENSFQPILKDIPKPPKVKLTSADGESTETIKDVTLHVKEQEDKAAKKLKPPLSLNRYSPLEKPHEPHELSTIAEVETPSASKPHFPEQIEQSGVGGIESFLNFEEYARRMASPFPEEEKDPTMLPQLGDLMQALDEMKITSFAKPDEYGIQEITHETEGRRSRTSSNASSIHDILDEMKRRNLVTKPFFSEADDENDDHHTTPTATHQVVIPSSPKRKPPASRIYIKTPENQVDSDKIGTPTKKRPVVERVLQAESPKSNDTLSGIQEIEKEPKENIDMGLGWVSSMMKKKEEHDNLVSSSSSSIVERGHSIQINIVRSIGDRSSTSSDTSSPGQPLNLREFLARELTRRSQKCKDQSDDSSLSSQFLRSLLNATSGRTSSAASLTSDHDKLRTSTPVQTKGSSSQFQGHKSGSLFHGESMSTLKGSEGEASGRSGGEEDLKNK